MLNIDRKGTYQDNTGFTWVYYGDTDQKNVFYIVPKPDFVYDNQNNPILKLVTVNSDDPKTKGSGFCHFEADLTIPANIKTAIIQDIPKRFSDAGTNILINAMDYDPGAYALLTLDDKEFTAPASEFGANSASFTIDLTADMMKTMNGLLTTSGGSLPIKYVMSVPASMPAVEATLSFNSAIAYNYQVTHAQHHTWSKDTPRSVQKILKSSNSSKVDITWKIENPPQQLVQAVADWANETLQALVTAEVNKALELTKKEDYDSFKISEVSSFSNVYSENQVISWFIYPQTSLPSLKDMGKNIADFTSTVDNRQETITIYAHLPFNKDSADNPNVPKEDMKPLLVEKVIVTVSYPGLSQKDATFTFTENGSHLFTAPYDAAHGDSFDVTYSATMKDSPGTITGKGENIQQGAYSLNLEAVGILSVTFNARNAFLSGEGEDNPLKEVDIHFQYANVTGLGTPVAQIAKIRKAMDPKRVTITSYTGYPINAPYNYTLSYVFDNGLRYTAQTQRNKNGFHQLIPKVNAVNETNLILAEQSTNPPVLDVAAKVWYDVDMKIPGVKNQPTKSSPATYKMTPKTGDGWQYAQDKFLGFVSGNAPLVYSASIDSLGGQVTIQSQKVANTTSSIMITPTQRYFTVEIMMDAIDWSSVPYSTVEVLITYTVDGEKQSQQSAIWHKGESQPDYITVAYNKGQKVTYDWTANYITPGQATQSQSGKKVTNTILNVPAKG
jgi:hypothetical protein